MFLAVELRMSEVYILLHHYRLLMSPNVSIRHRKIGLRGEYVAF